MTQEPVDSTLTLPPDAMRALGYRVVDEIVDHLTTLRSRPTTRRGTRATLEQLLREPPPEQPSDANDVLDFVLREVMTRHLHVDHPRFFGFVPGPGNFVGAMADALVAGLNPFVGTWLGGSGPTQLELVVIDWLRELCGLPERAGGLCVSGGSMANLTALCAARHAVLQDRLDGAAVYLSDQTHHSVERALRVIGLRRDQIRHLPSDRLGRLEIDALRRAVVEDTTAGRRPFCVVVNAGTTNTGATDDIEATAELCREHGMWLHADGAYGAAAILCDRGRETLRGLDRVDSLSLDPHKWLFQPFEIGCVLLRDRELLERTYTLVPDYMQDTERSDDEVNLSNYGIQLSRSFRALKLWMSIKVFGLAAFRAAVEHGIMLAERAETILRERTGWRIITPAQLGIVTFRHVPASLEDAADDVVDQLTRTVIERMYADGFAMVSTTSVAGRPVLRFCTINPRTTEADVIETIERFEQVARAGS